MISGYALIDPIHEDWILKSFDEKKAFSDSGEKPVFGKAGVPIFWMDQTSR
jgi:hypothetical protein